MNIKLEELRKRLLEPVITPVGPSADRYRRSSRELYADQPRSAEPGDSASDRRLPSAEAVVFWGNQRRIGQDPPRAADQPHSTEPNDSPSHQQSSGDAAASEPALAPEMPSGVIGAILQYVQQPTASSTAGESSGHPNGQYQVAQAVARLFERTRTFEDSFAELIGMFEPIGGIGQTAARSLEPLQSFGQQLVQLAHSFEAMRAFQIQLAQLAQTFEPMKGLQEQLAQLSEAFQIHLNRLVGSLQHAKEFQLELLKLRARSTPLLTSRSSSRNWPRLSMAHRQQLTATTRLQHRRAFNADPTRRSFFGSSSGGTILGLARGAKQIGLRWK